MILLLSLFSFHVINCLICGNKVFAYLMVIDYLLVKYKWVQFNQLQGAYLKLCFIVMEPLMKDILVVTIIVVIEKTSTWDIQDILAGRIFQDLIVRSIILMANTFPQEEINIIILIVVIRKDMVGNILHT